MEMINNIRSMIEVLSVVVPVAVALGLAVPVVAMLLSRR